MNQQAQALRQENLKLGNQLARCLRTIEIAANLLDELMSVANAFAFTAQRDGLEKAVADFEEALKSRPVA